MKSKFKSMVMVAIIFSMVSCATYPGVDSRLAEDLVDITKYDTKTDFKQYKTFSIVDSVVVIKDGDSLHILDSQAQALLNQIIGNMEARGYTYLKHDSGSPDLAINVGVVKITNVTYYYPGWYWDYGFYDPSYWGYYGYNYYYPYSPPAVSVYSSGTVIMDMLDLKNARDGRVNVVWVAIIRGLLTGYHTTQDILDNVDQCFRQTPQITAN
jgi:hypothetical protein